MVTPKWSLFIEAGCNYTIAVKEFALELGLICNISYERICLKLFFGLMGVKISRTTYVQIQERKI